MFETLWQIVSLSEFVVLILFALMTVIHANAYTAMILVVYMVKQLIERGIKSRYGDTGIGKRPDNARDCNMINKGGYSGLKPGFPSGHSAFAAMIMTIFLIEYLKSTNYSFGPQPPIVLYILIGLAILMPIARWRLECHTLMQVMAGSLLGVALGVVYGYGIDPLLSKIDRYKTDKDEFLKSIGFPVNS